ncbi:hypothetical protein TRAPUB_515 [Trametes pubescens]|uniref:Uncharacterized protein n=1 Tax=Trametes pubescens TaxID=154538 RepID=A0A1M2VLZ0_TRAPU|nr:hypothetical protein TRAPUB_515 [Trametes pubescens]
MVAGRCRGVLRTIPDGCSDQRPATSNLCCWLFGIAGTLPYAWGKDAKQRERLFVARCGGGRIVFGCDGGLSLFGGQCVRDGSATGDGGAKRLEERKAMWGPS